MELEEFCLKLEELYKEMGETFSLAQRRSGLSCPTGCGQCCLTPTVEASVLEMLPMALQLYKENKAEALYESLLNEAPETCILYQRHSSDGSLGQCSMYGQRPTICREFGVSGFRRKDGSGSLSVCKKLKTENPERFKTAEAEMIELQIPFLSDWSLRLLNIHPEILQKRLRISLALREALEKVLYYYSLKSTQATEIIEEK
ncbi:MAG: YkgJ family cysteine cluster protein [Bacteriovoracaceae bacterium]|nr:YkgJ family cysteine cluster protein [Bacteriovoracaceae bacterium]